MRKRSLGDFESAVSITCATLSGMSGRKIRGSGAVSLRWRSAVSTADSAWKGTCPVAISYSTTPSE